MAACKSQRGDHPIPAVRIGSAANPPSPSVGDAIKGLARSLDRKLGLSDAVSHAKTKIQDLKAEHAETNRLKKCTRLDKHDAAAAKATGLTPYDAKHPGNVFADVVKDNVHIRPNHAIISDALTKISDEIAQRLVASGRDPAQLRDAAVTNILVTVSAMNMQLIDLDHLAASEATFRAEGRTEKAELLRDLIDAVADARTPDGAERMFAQLAHHEMGNAPADSQFLRNTGNSGTAAVRKLISANGMAEYAAALKAKVAEVERSPEGVALTQHIQAEFAEDISKGKSIGLGLPMSRELAQEIMTHTGRLLKAMGEVPVPQGMREKLNQLCAELDKRADGSGDVLIPKLYGDQVGLKSIGPILVASDDPGTKMAGQAVQSTFNGVKDGGKFSTEPRTAYTNTLPTLERERVDMLTAIGMPH